MNYSGQTVRGAAKPKDAERGFKFEALANGKPNRYGGHFGRGDTPAEALANLRAVMRSNRESEAGWNLTIWRRWNDAAIPTETHANSEIVGGFRNPVALKGYTLA